MGFWETVIGIPVVIGLLLEYIFGQIIVEVEMYLRKVAKYSLPVIGSTIAIVILFDQMTSIGESI